MILIALSIGDALLWGVAALAAVGMLVRLFNRQHKHLTKVLKDRVEEIVKVNVKEEEENDPQ